LLERMLQAGERGAQEGIDIAEELIAESRLRARVQGAVVSAAPGAGLDVHRLLRRLEGPRRP
jgi:hypothetical protein